METFVIDQVFATKTCDQLLLYAYLYYILSPSSNHQVQIDWKLYCTSHIYTSRWFENKLWSWRNEARDVISLGTDYFLDRRLIDNAISNCLEVPNTCMICRQRFSVKIVHLQCIVVIHLFIYLFMCIHVYHIICSETKIATILVLVYVIFHVVYI